MLTHARLGLATLLVAGAATVVFAQGQPKGRPNHIKYKSTGVEARTGRAGSATLEARALMSNDGTMQVEASTGSLEGDTHPGTITRMQVKLGSLVANDNHLSGGGFWTASYPTGERGQQIELQATVRGIDEHRPNVVTATAVAALRPDLRVNSVSGPSQIRPHSSAGFVASVSEANGDTGARADCVMTVDGVAAASATGIWTDAGGTVSCAFTHVSAAPGTYTVRVSASNVRPRDWDSSNNHAATTITVLQPGSEFEQGYLQAIQHNIVNTSSITSDNAAYPYHAESEERRNESALSSTGTTQAFAGAMARVESSVFTNGALNHTATLFPSYGEDYDDGESYSRCRYYDGFVTGSGGIVRYSGEWTQMCAGGMHGDPQSQWVTYFHGFVSGDVTYFAKGAQCHWAGCDTWLENRHYAYGTGQDLGWIAGAVVRLKLGFVDVNGRVFTVDRSTTLEDRSAEVNGAGSLTQFDPQLNRTTIETWRTSGRYLLGQTWWPLSGLQSSSRLRSM